MKKWTTLLACLAVSSSLIAEVKVLAFAGSTRTDSYNKKLIKQAAEIAKDKGASVTVIDLRDYPMPFYDADLEAKDGMPPNAKKLRDLMLSSDAIMISSPEYNASLPGVLKNSLDWVSRGENGEGSNEAYKGKKFALMGASPGKSGAARALVHLKAVIENNSGVVISKQVTVPKAYEAFDEKGELKSAEIKEQLQEEVEQLIASVEKVANATKAATK